MFASLNYPSLLWDIKSETRMKSELEFIEDIYLALQTEVWREIKTGSFIMAIKTDGIRASLRNRIVLLSGRDGQDVQETIEQMAFHKVYK